MAILICVASSLRPASTWHSISALLKKIWETFSFWQHFTWWKLLVNTSYCTYNTIWLLTTCNCNSHIPHYYWQFFTRLFKIKFLTNRNDDTIHTRLLQQWQYITQDCSWSCMYMYVLLINIGITCTKGICSQGLIESSIDTQLTLHRHIELTPWTIKRHLSRQLTNFLLFHMSWLTLSQLSTDCWSCIDRVRVQN